MPAMLTHLPATLRSVEDFPDRSRELGARTRLDEDSGLPVAPHHFGQSPSGGGHERNFASHGLTRRQPKALVERGHHRQGGSRVQSRDVFGFDLAREGDRVLESQTLQMPPRVGLSPRRTDCFEAEIRTVAPQNGKGLEKVDETFDRRVGRQRAGEQLVLAGYFRIGVEDGRIDPDSDHADAVPVDAILALEIGLGGLRHGHHPIEAARHPQLLGQEGIPAQQPVARPNRIRGLQSNASIPGNRVVDRRNQRRLSGQGK